MYHTITLYQGHPRPYVDVLAILIACMSALDYDIADTFIQLDIVYTFRGCPAGQVSLTLKG